MRRSGRTPSTASLVTVTLLVLTACGSTAGPEASSNGAAPRSGSVSDELNANAIDSNAGVPAAGDEQFADTSTAQGPASEGTTSDSGGSTNAGGTGAGGPSAGGRARPAGWVPAGKGTHGVTDDKVQVGVWYRGGDPGAMAGQFGFNPLPAEASSGRPTPEAARAVADYINAHGGVAGRKLELIPHEIQAVTSQEQEYQAACANWTEDHSVFAIMASVGQGLGCAMKTDTVLLSDLIPGGIWASEASLKQARWLWYSPTFGLTERRGSALVESLWQRGWFPKGAKVGIIIEDQPWHKDGVSRGIIPALAKHGIKPTTQIVDKAAYETYVLQLRRDGVTHVLWSSSDGNFLPPLLMMRAANNQQYYPKWGFASDQAFGNGGVFGWPPEQMKNTSGIGWLPLLDTGDPKLSDSANARTCLKIGKDSGHTGAMYYCEVLFFLQHALNRAPEVSNAGMRAAMSRVADSYPSIQNLQGRSLFGPDRHDGPRAYRAVVFNNCSGGQLNCFRYVGPVQPL